MGSPEMMAGLVSLLLAVLGYFLRDAHARIKDALATIEDLRRDLNRQQLIMASDYVKRNELKEIEIKLDSFSEALFGKIDTLTQRVDHRLGMLADRVDSKVQSVQDKFDTQISEMSKNFYLQLQKKQDRN